MPEVQKPHCSALRATKACCRSRIAPVRLSPSMVSTLPPSACTASVRQPRTVRPFELDGAGAADAVLAAQVAALEAEGFAQEIHQVRAWRHAALVDAHR